MNNRILALFLSTLPACALLAAETGWVTYSGNVHMALEAASQTLNLSQFNAADVAASRGGLANEYTLTKVVFSIDGSISGTVEFENESPSAASNVKVRLFDLDDPNDASKSWSRVSYGDYSAVENYSASKTFGTVGADNDAAPDWTGSDYGRFDVTSLGTGAATSSDITTGLAAFLGTGTLPVQVDFQGVWSFDNLSNNSSQTSVFGDATVSVTYFYDYTAVPEPTSLALLGVGCAALLARRRNAGARRC